MAHRHIRCSRSLFVALFRPVLGAFGASRRAFVQVMGQKRNHLQILYRVPQPTCESERGEAATGPTIPKNRWLAVPSGPHRHKEARSGPRQALAQL